MQQNYSPETAAMLAQLQRNAQARPPAPGAAPAAMPGPTAPVPVGADPFARGGQVKELPGAGLGGKLGNIGVSGGAMIAGQQLGRSAAQSALASGVAQSGLRSALTSGASGAAAGAGISIGTDLLARKLRTKEEMPTFGGANAEYLDDLGRRFQGTGGGIQSNAMKYMGMAANPALVAGTMGLSLAAGALGGAIKGAITKHAPSAYTDFKVEDAANAIKQIYKKELGRDASDDEVMGNLVGQGWDPKGKDRWVGEKNLNSVLDQIRASPEAQAFKANGVAAGGAPAAPAGAPAPLGPLGEGGADPFATGRAALPVVPGATAQQGGLPPAATSPATAAMASRLTAPTVDTSVPAGATLAGGAGAAGFKLPAGTPDAYNEDGSGGMTGRGAGGIVPSGASPEDVAAGVTDGAQTSAPADAAAPADSVDRSTWNTDGYDPPAYTPPNVSDQPPPGWDATKWNDPTHQTPKYGVGRILSQFPPTLEGLQSAMGDIEKAYPGTTYDGKDKLTIPGVGTIDVLQGAGKGGEAWRWDDGSGGGEAAAGADAGAQNGLVDATGGASNQSDVTALIASLLGRQGASSSDGLAKTLLNQQRQTA